jgi:protein subunit release factor B
MSQKKQLLFSVTKKDFRVDTFRAGGKGGQNQNKTESGVRVTHIESGAVGEARDSRDQHSNKEAAFKRCIESPKFKSWHKIKTSFMLQGIQDGEKEIERRVNESMQDKNLKTEIKDEQGRWIKGEATDATEI